MHAQNQFFRANALGSYREILRGISRDAAMIRWLDLNTNRRAAPNENFARELLKLFTLGAGHFTEDDVNEVARALTGYHATPDGRFVLHHRQHDNGPKTIRGQTGLFDGDAVADLLAACPQTARFMATKLFRFFAYRDPEPAVIDRLADAYQQGGSSIKAIDEGIFRSPEFSTERAYRALIKSPAELIVGALRATGAERVPPQTPGAMRLLGQELFNPPHVAGWFGGRSWFNAATLLGRFNVVGTLVNQLGGPNLGGHAVGALLEGSIGAEARVGRVLDLLVDGDVSADERDALLRYAQQVRGEEQARGLFRLTTALPTYQLN